MRRILAATAAVALFVFTAPPGLAAVVDLSMARSAPSPVVVDGPVVGVPVVAGAPGELVFSGVAGQRVGVVLGRQSRPRDLGLGVVVRGVDGRVLVSRGWSPESMSMVVNVDLPAAGQYVVSVEVRSSGAAVRDTITARVRGSVVRAVVAGSATTVSVLPGQTVELTVAGQAGQRVDLVVRKQARAAEDTDLELEVFGSSSRPVTSAVLSVRDGQAAISFVPEVTGEYRVVIRPASPTGSFTGTLTATRR